MDELKLEEGIAIIGMAGRFPGAENIEQFWKNISQGVDSVSFFTEEELLKAGIAQELIQQPNYVKAKACLDNIEYFDAEFFGFTPKEATMTDPQQRLFLECAWEVLEHAGYNVQNYDGDIAVYAGTSANTYFKSYLSSQIDNNDPVTNYQISIGNDKDFLCTRVSYKLNLTGPSFTIQTACSTSLVSVSIACQALLDYQCDMALAGGVSVSLPNKTGYLYNEGMILSPDGHCRAFDVNSKGIVHGNGVGIVVLKRLQDALDDGDSIHAVIRGSALNNDGSAKIGYTAPSVTAQSKVISEALAVAEISADTISYVEAHGTGTQLGDPIEIAALTQAYRADTQEKNYCAIGSVKTNIGHLDVAAGVTGLIKTVLCLKHKKLVPHLHFTQPNPKIDFANSPFYVNTELKDWQTKDNIPRRAAVSSFGIGGTNAHVVLEESPPLISSSSFRPYQLIVLSARTESALHAQQKQLLEYFQAHTDINLNDAAYTLQIGRQAFAYRSIFACNSVQDAIEKLSEPASSIQYHLQTEQTQNIVFMFPGQGSQYVNMGLELYQTESVFKEHIDYCAQFLQPHLGLDLRAILYPMPEQAAGAEAQLTKTAITQPALFIVEYALSKLWMSWGIQPQAMIGHSIGEYVAACIAGVFCLEDALLLVAERGRLMQSVAEGSMLAVPLSESELKPLLIDNLDIAAINLFNQTVVSGADDVIQDFARQLHAKNIKTQVLHTSHAFHSAMMSGILFEFMQALQNVQFNPPQTLFISNLTGQWITTDEAINPDYWVQHLRHTVHFAQGLSQLFDAFNNLVLLEVGPGYTLTKFAKRHPDYNTDFCLPTLRHVDDHISDNQFIQQSLGQLWLANASINWKQFYAQEQRLRIPLPSYPFERKRYWVDVQPIQTVKTNDAMLNREILQRQNQSTNESVTTISPVTLSPVEQQLTEIWQQVLGVQNVGIHDDFFALGGDSLIAVQLIHRINTELQQDISSHGLLDAPTISKLSKRLNIDKNSQQERPFCLVEIQAGNPDKLPLFLVHPVGGHVYIYRDLAKSLGAEQPVYGLQSTVLDGKNVAPETIEQMATQYIQAIQTRQPTGPYSLGGASFGGVVAYEMAQQLEQKYNQTLQCLVLIDSPNPKHFRKLLLDDASILRYLLSMMNDEKQDLLSIFELLDTSNENIVSDNVLAQLLSHNIIKGFLPHTSVSELKLFLQVFKQNLLSMQKYEPEPYYSEHVIFFRASERDKYNLTNPEQGWYELVNNGMKLYQIQGNHITMNYQPHVQLLAKQLQKHLEFIV